MAKKLHFDDTDADTLAASDYVGANIIAQDVLITHTQVGAKEALDVYVANDIMVDLNGVYDVGTNPLPDNVGIIAHSRAAAPDETNQIERLTSGAASSDDVVAADVHALDVNSFGMVFDGTTWDRLRGTAGAVHIHDGGNSITVDAVDLDIRDLTAASDSVAAWLSDGAGNAITSSGGALDVNIQSMDAITLTVSDAALANTAVDNGEEDIVDTATKVIPTDLASRKYVYLYNHGQSEVYIGKQTLLAVANGFPIFPGVYLEARMGAAIALYGISKTGKTNNIRNLQLS